MTKRIDCCQIKVQSTKPLRHTSLSHHLLCQTYHRFREKLLHSVPQLLLLTMENCGHHLGDGERDVKAKWNYSDDYLLHKWEGQVDVRSLKRRKRDNPNVHFWFRDECLPRYCKPLLDISPVLVGEKYIKFWLPWSRTFHLKRAQTILMFENNYLTNHAEPRPTGGTRRSDHTVCNLFLKCTDF